MKKTKLTKALALLLALMMIAGSMSIAVSAEGNVTSSGATSSIDEVRELLNAISYKDYSERYADVLKASKEITIEAADYDKENTTADVKIEIEDNYNGDTGLTLYTPDSGTVSWSVDIPARAKYAVKIECYPVEGKATSIERSFRINGKIPFSEARTLVIHKIWKNEYLSGESAFRTDANGNQIRPTMVQAPSWITYVFHDSNGFYSEDFQFVFEAGTNIISIEAQNEPLAIRSITLYPYDKLPTYEEVLADYQSKGYTAASNVDPVKVEAETPITTSSNTIYPLNDRTSAVTSPQDTSKQLLNIIGGEKWQTVGQWITYEVEVPTSGLYSIVPRFKQSLLDGMFVSRSIKIDGEYPFEEAKNLKFEFASNWQTEPLNNGETNFLFYFEAGRTYTLEFEVTLGDMAEVIQRVEASLSTINNAYLTILKLTGANPDEYREYGFSRVMPDTIIDLIRESRNLYEVSNYLSEITGSKGEKTATLDKVAFLLGRMGGDEDEIAKNLENLKSYIGSLGTWVNDAKTQPLELDYFLVQPADAPIPKANAGFFKSIGFEISSFIMSFFTDYNSMGSEGETSADETVEVWLAYGRDQAQVIRNLINNDFTPTTGIPVNLKLVAASTLLPSVLSQQGPDSYIGLGQDNVINYAIRSAILPIEGFSTKNYAYDDVVKDFNDAAMAVMGIANAEGEYHVYGLPETQTFPMMFYRKDVLADLGIEIPKTWDDVLAAIPILQANNMQIGLSNDYKIFLYQKGGTLFADDGMRINLDSNVALESFEMMCNMFTMYSFPYKYDFANRFRTGEMPIGIAAYTATYNQLIVFATELKGLWEFVPMPGIVDEKTGEINNVSISTSSAIVMMNGCENKENTWDFMAWHVGADCQSKYSNEMVAIMGESAKHATANRQALAELPWTTTEYKNLIAQFENLASIPNYPGNYIIARYTNFAFLSAFDDLANPTEEMLSYVTTINKEITRKREEFGLETLELGQTLASKRLSQAKDELEDIKNTAYASQIEAAMAAIASETDIAAIDAAAAALESADANLFAKAIGYLRDASAALATY